MSKKNKQKMVIREVLRKKKAWLAHRPWYIYTTGVEIGQPFPLTQLQEGIYEKTGLLPKTDTILREAHDFYEKYDIPIIAREEPDGELFSVNQDIDLSKDSYRAIIQPPQDLGRPRERYTQIPEYRRKYNRNLGRLRRHPEKFLNKVFDSAKQDSSEGIAKHLLEFTEGIRFGPKTIERVLDKYITELRGPPYIKKTEPGIYRKVTKQTAAKYRS